MQPHNIIRPGFPPVSGIPPNPLNVQYQPHNPLQPGAINQLLGAQLGMPHLYGAQGHMMGTYQPMTSGDFAALQQQQEMMMHFQNQQSPYMRNQMNMQMPMPMTVPGMMRGVAPVCPPAAPPTAKISEGADEETATVSGTDWQRHTSAEGRIFWHNTKTGKSSWEQPEELKNEFERILETCSPWKSYPTPDGEAYWHNSETKASVWELPADVKDLKQKLEEFEKIIWDKEPHSSRSESQKLFKKFLEMKGIGSRSKWDDVLKLLSKSEQWPLFSKLSAGDRKHIFSEHAAGVQKLQREKDRIEKSKAKDDLMNFMKDWEHGCIEGAPLLTPGVTFEDDYMPLAVSASWVSALTPNEQMEIFEDHLDSLETQHLRMQSQRESRERIHRLLTLCSDLPCDAPFAEIERRLYELDPELETSVDRLEILKEWQILAEENCARQRKLRSSLLYQKERKRRDAFLELIEDVEKSMRVTAKIEWREFLQLESPPMEREELYADADLQSFLSEMKKKMNLDPSKPKKVSCDDRYLSLFYQGGSTARELFTDFVSTLWLSYDPVRVYVRKFLSPNSRLCEWLCLQEDFSASPHLIPLKEFIKHLEGDTELALTDPATAEKHGLPPWQKCKRPGILLCLFDTLARKAKKLRRDKRTDKEDGEDHAPASLDGKKDKGDKEDDFGEMRGRFSNQNESIIFPDRSNSVQGRRTAGGFDDWDMTSSDRRAEPTGIRKECLGDMRNEILLSEERREIKRRKTSGGGNEILSEEQNNTKSNAQNIDSRLSESPAEDGEILN